MKFVLLVEGHTEKDAVGDFLKRWLDPQLKQPVGMQVVPHQGHSQLERKLVTKARMHLDGPKNAEIVAVIGLLDLYGLDCYPSHLKTKEDRHAWGIDHFQKEVDRDRFRMFFAVHEFEAWLLSQPEIFPDAVRSALAKKIAHPEDVNFDQHPCALLEKLYRTRLKRSYRKTTDGINLFGELDPFAAAKKCPKLRTMLESMLELARNAGL